MPYSPSHEGFRVGSLGKQGWGRSGSYGGYPEMLLQHKVEKPWYVLLVTSHFSSPHTTPEKPQAKALPRFGDQIRPGCKVGRGFNAV